MRDWLISILGLYLFAAIAMISWVYSDAFSKALITDKQAGQVRLSEAISRLKGQLDVFRTLVDITAKDPSFNQENNPFELSNVNSDLLDTSLTYGAWSIDMVNETGRIIASSSPSQIDRLHPKRLVNAAMNGRLGYSTEHDDPNRLLRFSRKIGPSSNFSNRAIVVSTNLAALEFEWPITPEPIVFFDSNGISISSNRTNLLLLSNNSSSSVEKFPTAKTNLISGQPIWKFIPPNGVPTEVQVLTDEIPQLEMTGQILLNTKSARSIALLRAGLATALLATLFLVGAIFVQQRRRLAMESQHSATLEERVEERQKELRATQDKLVEASNLAALGRLSAGISHELNQPLAAILNFAENGRRLIKRSRTTDADNNLELIGQQVHRITRIIGNLRAFARQEPAPIERIDFISVINQSLENMRPDIEAAQIKINSDLSDTPVFIMAGEVRLEQVLQNLISNALDSMQSTNEKILTVQTSMNANKITLYIQDTGAGIQDTERVFEPFYSTKELGSSKGLGMGLSLSFGLVSRFGGQLTCRNLDKGAEFNLTLPIAEETT